MPISIQMRTPLEIALDVIGDICYFIAVISPEIVDNDRWHCDKCLPEIIPTSPNTPFQVESASRLSFLAIPESEPWRSPGNVSLELANTEFNKSTLIDLC